MATEYVASDPENALTGTEPDIAGRAVANTIQTKAERVLTAAIVKEAAGNIPDPQADPESLYKTIVGLKNAMEQLTRQRGNRGKSVVYVQELADLFEVVIRELDKRYSMDSGGVTLPDPENPDGEDFVTYEDLAQVAAALNAHIAMFDIHFGDAPNLGNFVRTNGQWILGMSAIEIATYVAEQIAAIQPPSGNWLERVQDDTAPALGGNLQLNGKGVVSRFVAGEALSPDNLCYLGTDGKMYLASAAQSSTCRQMLGVAHDFTSADVEQTFTLKGFHNTANATIGTVGEPIYVSVLTGMWTSTRPFGDGDVIRPVGYTTGSQQIFFDPDKTWLELQSQ